MADRVRTLTVILTEDHRDDDAREIADAIKMVKGVEAVELGEVVNFNMIHARSIAKNEIRQEIIESLMPDWFPKEPTS